MNNILFEENFQNIKNSEILTHAESQFEKLLLLIQFADPRVEVEKKAIDAAWETYIRLYGVLIRNIGNPPIFN